MEPSITVAFLALLFVGTHIGLATSRVRTFLVARLGQWGFALLFSTVAAVTYSLFIHTYATLRFDGAAGPALGRFVAFRIVGIAAIVTGVTLATASFWGFPASALPALNPRAPVPRGLERITRHPLFVGVALLGISHALLAGRLVGTVAFSALALLSVVGALHQDTKLRSQLGTAYADYLAQTSLVPFAAILGGRQRIAWNELPWTGLAVGIGIAFGLRAVHASIMANGGAWVIGAVLGGALLATALTIAQRRRTVAAKRPIGHSASRVEEHGPHYSQLR